MAKKKTTRKRSSTAKPAADVRPIVEAPSATGEGVDPVRGEAALSGAAVRTEETSKAALPELKVASSPVAPRRPAARSAPVCPVLGTPLEGAPRVRCRGVEVSARGERAVRAVLTSGVTPDELRSALAWLRDRGEA